MFRTHIGKMAFIWVEFDVLFAYIDSYCGGKFSALNTELYQQLLWIDVQKEQKVNTIDEGRKNDKSRKGVGFRI